MFYGQQPEKKVQVPSGQEIKQTPVVLATLKGETWAWAHSSLCRAAEGVLAFQSCFLQSPCRLSSKPQKISTSKLNFAGGISCWEFFWAGEGGGEVGGRGLK